LRVDERWRRATAHKPELASADKIVVLAVIGGNRRYLVVVDENDTGFVPVDCWLWSGSLPVLNFSKNIAKEERRRSNGYSA
jgi:hypothetical protein